MSHALLVELQTEELPPKALKALGEAFASAVVEGLGRVGLVEADTGFETFATPRRLAVRVPAVRVQAADREVVERLMPKAIAFDAEGKPSDALKKRLDKSGRAALLDRPDLTEGPDRVYVDGEGKAATAYLKTVAAGRTLDAALQGIVEESLAKLPIPRRMTYQRYDDAGVETVVQFVRPAHRVVALHGDRVVDLAVLGIRSGRVTAGHRFLSSGTVTIDSADDYADALRERGKVVASFDERAEAIRAALAQQAGDDRVVAPDALVDEVTALVEWPVVYRGRFDEAFLDVPQECLILTMQQNQKYFALTDAGGKMVHRFLVVSNLATDDASAIVGGNERVLRARLSDAKFFFDQDRRKTLASRVDGLRAVVYHNKLGSQFERMRRVEAIAGRIAGLLGHDAADARRAAYVAKADLLTDMVGEFPELQGLMGRYYATHDGEKPDVAAALEEQYRPRFAGDALPATATGLDLALADKLETLVGMFAIGAVPTGDKDPFALRRHALGIVRMLVEKEVKVPLATLLGAALDAFPAFDQPRDDLLGEAFEFVRVRLAGYCRELGYSTNEVDAVLHTIDDGLVADVPKRLEAVRAFASLPESASLAAADKRVRNILAKSDRGRGHALEARKLTADAEIALHGALVEVERRSEAAMRSGDFSEALRVLASLRIPVDRFFDEVMVNADDPAVRANRLGLLDALHRPMNRIADLSKLAA